MAKMTIIGATGRVGSYAAHVVSQFPHVRRCVSMDGRAMNSISTALHTT